jgi:hypothetical protein
MWKACIRALRLFYAAMHRGGCLWTPSRMQLNNNISHLVQGRFNLPNVNSYLELLETVIVSALAYDAYGKRNQLL